MALVSPYSLSVPGGVQGQVLGLAAALLVAGHEVAVLGPLDGPLRVRLPPGTVTGVGRSVPVPANGSVARLAINPLSSARTLHALAGFRPDVVHLHEPLAPGATWTALLRGGAKVGTFHRAGVVTGAPLLAPAARRLAGRLAVRTAVSEDAAATARALAGGTYRIVGNGVDFGRFSEAELGAVTRASSAPTVLFVGRHEPRKGLAVLLDAFGRLAPVLGAQLWVAGEGPETAELRRLGGGRAVEWLGRLDDDELARRLRQADVLCAPALHGESFGVVLLEAMAGRAVVVASDIPGYAAVVGAHGVLVPPGDAIALAGALSAVVSDVMGGRGSASAESLDGAAAHARQWSMDVVAQRYLEVYADALAPGPVGSGS